MQEQKEQLRAVISLLDEISNAMLDCERAEYALSELVQGYFGMYSRDNEVDHIAIIYEHERSAIFADIVSDYLFSIRERLGVLNELASKTRQKKPSITPTSN